MIKIALFDDAKERRESLALLLEQEADFTLVGAFKNGLNAVERIANCQPDVILMDIEMPGENGISATKKLKAAFPKVVVLMQTIAEDDENLFQSIQAGASGYILKRAHPNKIIEAIYDAVNGGAPLSPAMAFKMLKFFQNQSPEIPNQDYGISKREKEILGLLVDGLSYKMISDKEKISYHTVNSHIRNIYEKLHVHSIGEAVSKALKEDLLH